MNEEKISQEEVWDAISEKWGEFRVVIDENVKEFLKSKNGKILDIGCGSGRNFLKDKDIQFYAVDFSSNMLEFAKNKAKKLKIDVTFKKANSWELPFEDNFFDNALLYAVIHCVETRENRIKTIKEMYRVLKKNGTAYVSCWSGKSPRLQKHKEVSEAHVPWTVDGKTYERYTYIFKDDELKKMLEDAGFVIEKSWEDRNINFVVRK